MRAIILAAIIAVGIALVGMPDASAAPANGASIGEGAKVSNAVEKVQHWRRRSHWRWGSRGGGCHVSGSSRWVPC